MTGQVSYFKLIKSKIIFLNIKYPCFEKKKKKKKKTNDSSLKDKRKK